MESMDIIIDTDIALGIPERDVDDALAIVMAANSHQVNIEAVTLTYGNAQLPDVERCMSALNEYLNIPEDRIASGAGSSDDLGSPSSATDLIISKLETKPAILVSIGPLTNIATALQLKPHIASNIKEIVVVAGRRPGQRFLTGNYPLSHPDLNFEKDPQAARILIDSGVHLVLAPFEVSSKIWITDEILELIKQNRTPLAEYLYIHCRTWLEFWKRRFSTKHLPIIGFNPFDCLAVAWLTDRELLQAEDAVLTIEEDSYDMTDVSVQGTGNAGKNYFHVRPTGDSANRSSGIYLYDVAREDFLDKLIPRLK